jgi:hypothetical protein
VLLQRFALPAPPPLRLATTVPLSSPLPPPPLRLATTVPLSSPLPPPPLRLATTVPLPSEGTVQWHDYLLNIPIDEEVEKEFMKTINEELEKNTR